MLMAKLNTDLSDIELRKGLTFTRFPKARKKKAVGTLSNNKIHTWKHQERARCGGLPGSCLGDESKRIDHQDIESDVHCRCAQLCPECYLLQLEMLTEENTRAVSDS